MEAEKNSKQASSAALKNVKRRKIDKKKLSATIKVEKEEKKRFFPHLVLDISGLAIIRRKS